MLLEQRNFTSHLAMLSSPADAQRTKRLQAKLSQLSMVNRVGFLRPTMKADNQSALVSIAYPSWNMEVAN